GYRGGHLHHQPPPPGLSRGNIHNGNQAGTIDDPLEAFERMLREKEERDHKLRRRRSRSPRSYSPRSRSRSTSSRSYTRSRSRSRSRSRTRSRTRTPRSRTPRSRSPRKRSRTRTRSRSRTRSFTISRYQRPYKDVRTDFEPAPYYEPPEFQYGGRGGGRGRGGRFGQRKDYGAGGGSKDYYDENYSGSSNNSRYKDAHTDMMFLSLFDY
ncbi:hypothetical protein C0J52_18134, partial [Blattella germanica]